MSQGAISILEAWNLPVPIRKVYLKRVKLWWTMLQKHYAKMGGTRCPFLGGK